MAPVRPSIEERRRVTTATAPTPHPSGKQGISRPIPGTYCRSRPPLAAATAAVAADAATAAAAAATRALPSPPPPTRSRSLFEQQQLLITLAMLTHDAKWRREWCALFLSLSLRRARRSRETDCVSSGSLECAFHSDDECSHSDCVSRSAL